MEAPETAQQSWKQLMSAEVSVWHIKILLLAHQSVPTLVAAVKFLVLNTFLKHADKMTGLPDARR